MPVARVITHHRVLAYILLVVAWCSVKLASADCFTCAPCLYQDVDDGMTHDARAAVLRLLKRCSDNDLGQLTSQMSTQVASALCDSFPTQGGGSLFETAQLYLNEARHPIDERMSVVAEHISSQLPERRRVCAVLSPCSRDVATAFLRSHFEKLPHAVIRSPKFASLDSAPRVQLPWMASDTIVRHHDLVVLPSLDSVVHFADGTRLVVAFDAATAVTSLANRSLLNRVQWLCVDDDAAEVLECPVHATGSAAVDGLSHSVLYYIVVATEEQVRDAVQSVTELYELAPFASVHLHFDNGVTPSSHDKYVLHQLSTLGAAGFLTTSSSNEENLSGSALGSLIEHVQDDSREPKLPVREYICAMPSGVLPSSASLHEELGKLFESSPSQYLRFKGDVWCAKSHEIIPLSLHPEKVRAREQSIATTMHSLFGPMPVERQNSLFCHAKSRGGDVLRACDGSYDRRSRWPGTHLARHGEQADEGMAQDAKPVDTEPANDATTESASHNSPEPDSERSESEPRGDTENSIEERESEREGSARPHLDVFVILPPDATATDVTDFADALNGGFVGACPTASLRVTVFAPDNSDPVSVEGPSLRSERLASLQRVATTDTAEYILWTNLAVHIPPRVAASVCTVVTGSASKSVDVLRADSVTHDNHGQMTIHTSMSHGAGAVIDFFDLPLGHRLSLASPHDDLRYSKWRQSLGTPAVDIHSSQHREGNHGDSGDAIEAVSVTSCDSLPLYRVNDFLLLSQHALQSNIERALSLTSLAVPMTSGEDKSPAVVPSLLLAAWQGGSKVHYIQSDLSAGLAVIRDPTRPAMSIVQLQEWMKVCMN